MELRGPGDLMGTQQSGVLDLKVADLIKDRVLLEDARDIARGILAQDPELTEARHALLKAGWSGSGPNARIGAAFPDS